MQITQLEYFIELAKHSTFSETSQHLYIAPQSLSRSIDVMEKEIGCQLIHRYPKGYELTQQGREFLEMAIRIVKDFHSTIKRLDSRKTMENNNITGQIHLYTYAQITDSILSNLVLEFKTLYPYIEIKVHEILELNVFDVFDSNEDSNKIMIGMEMKLTAISEDELRNNGFTRIALPLLSGEYVLCCPKDSPLTKHKSISLKKVFQYPQIFFAENEHSINPFFTSHFPKSGVTIALITQSHIEQINAIKNNIGISIMFHLAISDQSAIKDLYKNIATIPLKEKMICHVYLYAKNPNNCTTAFIDFVTKKYT